RHVGHDALRPARVLFHDLVLLTRGTGIPVLEPLLGHFPAASERDGVTLPIDIEVSSRPSPPAPGRCLATMERVTLHETARGWLFSDGASWAEAIKEPVSVHGEVASDAGEHGSAKEVAYTALLVALRSLGVYELHSAAVQAREFALLIVGNSGSGKTTLATALLEAGCGYLGDDRVLLREAPDETIGLCSFPAAFRLTAATASAFPRLASCLGSAFRPKRELDLRAAFPGRHVPRASSPRFLLFPVRASHTELVRLSPGDALTRLLPQSSSLVVPDHPAPERQLRALRSLAQSAVTLEARLGPEWLEDPVAAARELLARCSAGN
ncbi:MAG TPA: hypothetical protein VM686_36830, partial [Polyangiaceae bacterium]|nr:hypothetical protein [Polyangiaceae bacterium]